MRVPPKSPRCCPSRGFHMNCPSRVSPSMVPQNWVPQVLSPKGVLPRMVRQGWSPKESPKFGPASVWGLQIVVPNEVPQGIPHGGPRGSPRSVSQSEFAICSSIVGPQAGSPNGVPKFVSLYWVLNASSKGLTRVGPPRCPDRGSNKGCQNGP